MDYRDARVFITGAEGFIGSHLTEALVRAGASVTALALYNSFDSHGWLDEVPHHIRSALDVVRGDVRDPGFIQRIVPGHDVIFHLAALIAIPHSYVAAQSYVETNVLGTLNVLEAARQCGVSRVVHTSSSEVYGTALTMPISEQHPLQGQSPYSASKIGADMLAQSFALSFDLPVAILRPFNTFGPRQSERAIVPTLIRQALDPSCQVLRVGDLTPIRDLTFIQETVAAFLAIGCAPGIRYGQPYNAGSGRQTAIADLVTLIFELTDCGKDIAQDPARLRPASSEVRALLADSTALEAATGWRPQTDLRDGLVQTIAWWRSRLAAGLVRQQWGYMT
ncbi:SDR family NAD(P)-dependent oxidoreductase [Methylobacterium sp. CM6257]